MESPVKSQKRPLGCRARCASDGRDRARGGQGTEKYRATIGTLTEVTTSPSKIATPCLLYTRPAGSRVRQRHWHGGAEQWGIKIRQMKLPRVSRGRRWNTNGSRVLKEWSVPLLSLSRQVGHQGNCNEESQASSQVHGRIKGTCSAQWLVVAPLLQAQYPFNAVVVFLSAMQVYNPDTSISQSAEEDPHLWLRDCTHWR